MYKFDSIEQVLVAQRGNINSSTKSIVNVIDTFGYAGGLALVTVMLDQVNSTPPVIGTCQIVETDILTEAATVIPGCDAVNDLQANGVANEFPVGQADDNSLLLFYIPLINRKRYFSMVVTETAGANVGVTITALLLGESVQKQTSATSSLQDGPAGSVYRATQ
tara:strand:+ start:4853 stop:5344 length:492 start_codon:yes stop_codon:yes gene_type:complete